MVAGHGMESYRAAFLLTTKKPAIARFRGPFTGRPFGESHHLSYRSSITFGKGRGEGFGNLEKALKKSLIVCVCV